jgi:hypothetical protein
MGASKDKIAKKLRNVRVFSNLFSNKDANLKLFGFSHFGILDLKQAYFYVQ